MRKLRYDDGVYFLSVARSCVDLKMKKFSKALDDLEQVLRVEPENLKGLQFSNFFRLPLVVICVSFSSNH